MSHGMATSWMTDILGFICQQGQMGKMFSYSPKRQRPGLGPHSILFRRYQRLFAWRYSQDVELNIHLSLMPVLGIYVALFLPPWVFMAWCLIKHKDEFTFTNMDKELKKGDFHRVVCERQSKQITVVLKCWKM